MLLQICQPDSFNVDKICLNVHRIKQLPTSVGNNASMVWDNFVTFCMNKGHLQRDSQNFTGIENWYTGTLAVDGWMYIWYNEEGTERGQ